MPYRPLTAALLTTLTAATMALAACGGGDGGATTLRVLMHSNPAADTFFKDILIPAYERRYPDVKVRLDLVDTNDYDGVAKTRFTAKAVDLMETGAGSPQPAPAYAKGANEIPYVTLARSGGYEDLSSEPYAGQLLPAIGQRAPINGKLYAFPVGVTVVNGVYYDKSVFERYGLQAPTTWSEFVAVCETLKQHGVPPLSIGGKDVWPAGLVMLGVVDSLYPDLAALDRGLWEGTARLDDPTGIQVLERIKQVYSYAESTFPGTAYSAAPSRFTSGKVAMTVDGSWAQPDIAKAMKDPGQLGYFPLPGSDTAADNVFGSKTEVGLSVPAAAKNKTAAKNFIRLFAEPDTYRQYLTATGVLPSIQLSGAMSPFIEQLRPQLAAMKTEWEPYYHAPANVDQSLTYPFDYTSIAPLGKEQDMAALATRLQRGFDAARKED